MNIKFSTGDLDLKENRRWFREVEKGNDDMFKCDCGSGCEDRIHMVGEGHLYQREKYIQVNWGKMKDTIEMPLNPGIAERRR